MENIRDFIDALALKVDVKNRDIEIRASSEARQRPQRVPADLYDLRQPTPQSRLDVHGDKRFRPYATSILASGVTMRLRRLSTGQVGDAISPQPPLQIKRLTEQSRLHKIVNRKLRPTRNCDAFGWDLESRPMSFCVVKNAICLVCPAATLMDDAAG